MYTIELGLVYEPFSKSYPTTMHTDMDVFWPNPAPPMTCITKSSLPPTIRLLSQSYPPMPVASYSLHLPSAAVSCDRA